MGESNNTFPNPESLRKQLELVDVRMRHHILRFWALALTYITAVVVSARIGNAINKVPSLTQKYGLLVLGILILVAMYAAFEGTMRSIDDVSRIETELGLENTPKKKSLQFIPYALIVVVGMIYSVFL